MPEDCTSTVDIRPKTCTPSGRRSIGALAARQHGVVAGRQLASLGVTPSMLKTRIANGHLVRLHRGVYAVGHRRLRREGFWLAAVLAAGPGAVLSHRDAAALHDLRPANHARTDVTTARRGPRGHRTIEIHHTTVLTTLDVTVVAGIPVTTVARTLVDLASVVAPAHLARAVSVAEQQGTLDVVAVEAALDRTRGRRGRGHAALRAVLAEHRRRGIQLTHSELEHRFARLVDVHGLPLPELNARIDGMEVDAVWRARRLAVELDGYAFHHGRHAFQRDRDKANTLTAKGWRVFRFTHDDVLHRPQEVAARLRALLAA